MRLFLTILFLLICIFCKAVTVNYYVSSAGNDAANGLTPATAWQTITKVNAMFSSFAAGDSILFRRGDVFYGSIIVGKSGSITLPITLGAYGTGALPVFSGFTVLTGWTNAGGGVWTKSVPTASVLLSLVTIDNQIQRLGRYPNFDAINDGYLTYEDTTFSPVQIIDSQLTSATNWTGAEVAIRKVRWIIDRGRITNHTGMRITYTNPITVNTYYGKRNFGYFFQDDIRTLDQFGEWFLNKSTKVLSVYFGATNPASYTIKASTIDTLINCGGATSGYPLRSHIIISNIAFEGANSTAFYSADGSNVSVKNCTFNNCVDAIYMWNITNSLSDGNTITNTLNGAIQQYGVSKPTIIRNNTITNCGLFAGMGRSGDGMYCGLRQNGNVDTIENNRIDSVGYNALEFNGNDVLVRRNYITNYCMVKDDGGGIYTWSNNGNTTYSNRTVRDNIVINGVGAEHGTAGGTIGDADAIYMDGGANNVNILNNTLIQATNSAIFINNGVNLRMTGNTFYNIPMGITMNRFAGAPLLRNIYFTDNISYPNFDNLFYWNASLNTPTTTTIQNDMRAIFLRVDSNYYRNDIGAPFDYYYHLTSGGTFVNPPSMSYAQWVVFINSEANSGVISTNPKTLEYNPTNEPDTVLFQGFVKKDPRGVTFVNSAIIPAWSSILLIDDTTAADVTATLDGTASFDPDGIIISWLWEKMSGPAGGDITSPTDSITDVTGLLPGVYQYRLTVTDNGTPGLIGQDIKKVTVNSATNQPPVAAAGSDQVKTLPTNTATLNGTGSTDADGTISSYSWVKAGSSPSSGTIANANTSIATMSDLIQGIYTIVLTVTDNDGAVGIDTMRITVNPDPSPGTADGFFSFILDTTYHVSIGVFKKDSILVRTIWSDSIKAAGTYSLSWDGKDDTLGVLQNPDTTYKIKIQKNKIRYEWKGTLGNTSTNITGNNKHQGYYSCATGLAFATNGYAYLCNGFSEGEPTYKKMLTTTPNVQIPLYPITSTRILTLNTEFVATDNINVYWAGFDSYAPAHSMVHAIRASDDANVSFSTGVPYTVTYGVVLPSVISKIQGNTATTHITGLAVQKTGSYLFVTRGRINELQVLDKTTGALVQTLTYTAARQIAVDGSDNLWMISGTNTVAKYTVNAGGTLSAPTLTLAGMIYPLAVQVSTDGTTVVVMEGSTQQVKGYNNTSGAASWTLGTAGGYITDATVNNTKFYTQDLRDSTWHSFIAYQPDGSFWINDPGNFRIQHYSAGRAFVDRIMYLPSVYHTMVDPNISTRVFAGPLEFSVDYSQPLTGSTGWALVKNWGANMGAIYNSKYLFYPTTLSNGRTYALMRRDTGPNNREIVELPSTGQLRFTNTYRTGVQVIAKDGAIQTYNKLGIGNAVTFHRFPLTGFSGAGNPIWAASPEVAATTPILTIYDPNDIITNEAITSTNKVIIWNPDIWVGTGGPYYVGYHLAAIPRGKDYWLWRTEHATHQNYRGPYPGAGYFDIGNLVHNNAGATTCVLGRNVITGYHGEFWKNTQTNKYNHYLDNGLALGQFGKVKEETTGNSPAEFAGNALTQSLVADPNDVNSMYFYHGDESSHSGVHQWKISALNTITEEVITIRYPSAYVAPSDYVDLMAGLPYAVQLPDNTAGWTRFPTTQVPGWSVLTNNFVFDKKLPIDINVSFQQSTAQTYYVNRDLGVNNVATDWKITGQIGWGGAIANTANTGAFLEILDNANKVIARIHYTSASIFTNSASIPVTLATKNYFKDFNINMVNGTLSMSYNGTWNTVSMVDVTADWRKPTTLKVRVFNNPPSTGGRGMTIGFLRLYKDIL